VLYDDKYLLPGDLGALLVLMLVVGAVWLVVRLVRRPSA
jgi:flagellar biogenesis protein FliO